MKRLLFLFSFLIFLLDLEGKEEKRPKICLNMIVKNETKVIERCLESVKPLIDYWVIIDTGSTDGTQKMIKNFMKDIPGKLYERPWVNFEHNRNEALKLAKDKGDYLLFIDADDIFTYSPDFKKPQLDKDGYYIKIQYNGLAYDRIQLVKSSLDWKWIGVVHEVLISPELKSSDTLKDVTMVIIGGGDRSRDPKKYLKDAALLEKAIQKDPFNARNVFYLAQSYRDAGEIERAIESYEKRMKMGGWDQEVYWSLYEIAMLQKERGLPDETICSSFTKAFQYRPSRVEPLYRLSNHYRLKENYLLGYLYAQFGLTIPQPNDVLFVESWIYDYGLLLEYSVCAYWIGRYEESLIACQKLLSNQTLPEHVRECVEKNMQFAVDKLADKAREQMAQKAG